MAILTGVPAGSHPASQPIDDNTPRNIATDDDEDDGGGGFGVRRFLKDRHTLNISSPYKMEYFNNSLDFFQLLFCMASVLWM